MTDGTRDFEPLPKDQFYIRSASVYRLGGLLRTTNICLEAGELGGEPVLGIERDTDLVEVDVVQLSGPPARIYMVLAWWPFDGGGYGYLGANVETRGGGEVPVRFDPKGCKVPAMFGIGALDAREKGPEPKKPSPPVQYDKRDVALGDYIIGRGVVLTPQRVEIPMPERWQRVFVDGHEFVVTAVEFNASKTRWGAIVREVQEMEVDDD